MHLRRVIQLFILGLAIGGSLGFADPSAQAAYFQYGPAMSCTPNSSTSSWSMSGGSLFGGSSVTMYCAVPSDTDMRHDGIAAAGIDVCDNDASLNISATACIANWDASGGQCDVDQDATTGNSCHDLLLLNRTGTDELTYWSATNGADYPYIQISLPSSSTSIVGFYLTS